MTFEDYMAARSLLVEERVGTHLREAQAGEDLSFEAARAALGAG